MHPDDEQRRRCVVSAYRQIVDSGRMPRGAGALDLAFQVSNRWLQARGFQRHNSERPTAAGARVSRRLSSAPGALGARREFDEILAEARGRRRGSKNTSASLPASVSEIRSSLVPLRAAMEKVFACDTAYGDCLPDRPSGGHCMLSAMAVQDLFGGSVVQGEVKRIPHYWSRVGNVEIDLTGDQFGKGFAPIRVKRGKLHDSWEFFRRPYESLSQPFNNEACRLHDRFIRRLSAQLRKDGHDVWADVLARGGCAKQ